MISIVLVGRNDNYGGDFEARLRETLRHNTAALAARGLDHEVVFVEWNPLPDRPLLSPALSGEFGAVRGVVVEPAVHRWMSRNRSVTLFEYHAKNVGARRARGQWLLLTNPDNYLGAAILDFLADGPHDPDTLYRAGRADVDGAAEVDAPGVHDAYPDDPPPYIQCSGDFAFCSRTLFTRIGGYREDLAFTNTHKDAIFCVAVEGLTGRTRKIGTTFHLRHPKDDAGRRRLEYDWRRVTHGAQPEFGLHGVCTETEADGVTHLRLPDAIRADALARRVPRGRVPRAYRISRLHRLRRHPLAQRLVRCLRGRALSET